MGDRFTAGPWSFYESGGDCYVTAGHPSDGDVELATVLNHFPGDPDVPRDVDLPAEANARLIAAAPEMLEVLRDFVFDWDNGLQPSVDRLRTVIAKATAGK